VHQAQRSVAALHGIGDDADSGEIGYLLEAYVLFLYLLGDGVDVLRPALHSRTNPDVREPLHDRRAHGVYPALALLTTRPQQTGYLIIPSRIEITKGAVLQLPLVPPDAQAVGERSEDVLRLHGGGLPLFRGEWIERAHVVEAVSKLHDDDPGVARHGEEHLAQVASLLLLPAGELQALQLCHAVHQGGYRLTEVALDVFDFHLGVLNGVVQ